ncbi:MAG: RNA polymerase subunit sigma-24, partial [Candidatus Atribacteria bacterium]|nr:RNA polymerase subunit sigma-24 [Candidatus Atribacteria bacterium]
MIESEAIARLKEGDISGLETLVKVHQLKAVRTAYLIVRDYFLAEDVVEDAFLRAYERINQFDT